MAELPTIGVHCALPECNQIDFLPYVCDLCKKEFCQDHRTVEQHACTEGYRRDAKVPVCPICNQPLPVRRGEDPNVRMNQHIASGCSPAPGNAAASKAYSNRCNKPGCKKKELVPVTCARCKLNFCLKHRFEADHECSGPRGAASDRANAAAARAQAAKGRTGSQDQRQQQQQQQQPKRTQQAASGRAHANNPQGQMLSHVGGDLNRQRQQRHEQQRQQQQQPAAPGPAAYLTEDEALARAIQASLEDQGPSSAHDSSRQRAASNAASKDQSYCSMQ